MLLRYTMAITHTASLPMADARKIIDEIKDIDLGDGVALFQQVMLLLHMRLSTNISCCWRIALSVSSHNNLETILGENQGGAGASHQAVS